MSECPAADSGFDRRSLLTRIALAGAGVAVFGRDAVASGHHNVASGLDRGYCPTPFGQVHYWTTGSGPLLVMIHQSSQSSDEYARIAPLLADDHRVVAIDLPGHGRSDDPDHELEVAELTDATIAVLDHLGAKKIHMLGHHGGIAIVIDLAVRQPKRVDRVVLSGAGVETEQEQEAIESTPLTRDLPIDEQGDFLAATWETYRRMSARRTPPEITFLPFLVSLQARLRPFDMHHALYRWEGEKARVGFDKRTLLLAGSEDHFGGDVAARHRQMQRSTMIEIADGGAWLFYEQPEACANAIREFLKPSNP